jgi:hypothetical protein
MTCWYLTRAGVGVVGGGGVAAQHRVLPDRLRLVLRYSDGRVALWHVARGRVEADYGAVPFEAKCDELTQQVRTGGGLYWKGK